MSIAHLKKQSKNLQKSLPDFLKRFPDGSAPLAQFQELIAKASGYPSWHAAVESKGNDRAPFSGDSDKSIHVRITHEPRDLVEYTIDGGEKLPREFDCVTFKQTDRKLLALVTARLDKFFDEAGTSDEYGDEGPPIEHSHEMAELCRQLIRQDPSFIDGYAHLGNALYWLNEHAHTISVCRPFFDQLCALLPIAFNGRVVYSHLDNRPFFRLAHTLVLAYYGLKTDAGNEKALALAEQMLKWWPNDNMGFRFLLTPSDDY